MVCGALFLPPRRHCLARAPPLPGAGAAIAQPRAAAIAQLRAAAIAQLRAAIAQLRAAAIAQAATPPLSGAGAAIVWAQRRRCRGAESQSYSVAGT
jgi:hypothetical protein